MVDADEILKETEPRYERAKKYLRDAAQFFHNNEGELFSRPEAQNELSEQFDVPKSVAHDILSELVADTVDPVIQVEKDGKQFVGVVEFKEFDGAYGYLEYDDRFGPSKRVVCQQCVNEATLDTEVTHATENDPHGSFSDGADYNELVKAIHSHYRSSHDSQPSEIETGASLVTGTTVGGNTSIHTGNEGDLSFYDGSKLSASEVEASSKVILPSASEGDTITEAGVLAYDSTNEQLLVSK